MEFIPAFAFFIGAAYLVYRLRQIDSQIIRIKRKLEDTDGKN